MVGDAACGRNPKSERSSRKQLHHRVLSFLGDGRRLCARANRRLAGRVRPGRDRRSRFWLLDCPILQCGDCSQPRLATDGDPGHVRGERSLWPNACHHESSGVAWPFAGADVLSDRFYDVWWNLDKYRIHRDFRHRHGSIFPCRDRDRHVPDDFEHGDAGRRNGRRLHLPDTFVNQPVLAWRNRDHHQEWPAHLRHHRRIWR